MSRHVLVDRPGCYVVLGFDHMLQSFFGQRFRSRADGEGAGNAVDVWPTASGLGTRRPAANWLQARQDVDLLVAWARAQQPPAVWRAERPAEHLDQMAQALMDEWETGTDREPSQVPPGLMGPLP